MCASPVKVVYRHCRCSPKSSSFSKRERKSVSDSEIQRERKKEDQIHLISEGLHTEKESESTSVSYLVNLFYLFFSEGSKLERNYNRRDFKKHFCVCAGCPRGPRYDPAGSLQLLSKWLPFFDEFNLESKFIFVCFTSRHNHGYC